MANSQPESNVFSVRIVSIDHLMAPPVHGFDVCYSSFQGEKVNEVPVIRIYGPTPAGQKTCLHVHGVLPYLYVPCVELCPKGSTTHEEADRCAHELAVALEKALKLKGNVCSKRQHVHDCRVVCGKRFYGYHKLEELFVKIYLYYPHDVPRAATLLLNGGVLDKSLQPHESHIPYILQFLIDCNLYGMGHIHLSRLKFRHPVPEAVSPRRIIHAQSREGMNDSTPEATHFQADPGEVAYSSPVWTSSSVPVDWTWHASNELGTSSNEDISLLKRQSICELECDAVVDDILNREFKTYASLSQSCSDVKLVQSLVPIWQEEYERTGMLEGTFLCNPEKPTPEDVLRTLSLGIGFESKLMELCGDVYQSSCKRDIGAGHSMLPSAVMQSLPEIASDSPNYVCPEPMRDLHEKDTVGFGTLNCSPHKKETGATSSKERDACSDLLFAGNVVASDLKATDFEALELLRWLATSQAAEDINSDDELIRETILTPILPAPAIDKVLEKASMDYESESQKECQDILDSVEDLVDFRCPEERASNVSEDTHLLVSKMVPQRDGSSDDPSSSFRAESGTDSLQKDAKQAECKKFLQYSEPQGCNTCSSSNSKPNKRLWGTLPISAAKTVSNESYACLDEVKDSAGAGSFVQNRLDKRPDDFISRETSGLTGRSVRDLMRRKRSRTEPAGCGSFKTKRLKFNEEREKYISLCRKKLEFHESHEDKYESKPPEYTCDRPLFMNQHAEVHEAVSLKTAHSEGRLDNVPISNNSYNSLEMYAHPCTAQVWGKSKLISKTKIQDFAAPMVHSELNDGKESESGLCPVETMYSRTQTSKSDLPCSVKKFGLKDKSSIDDHLQKECASSGCVSDFSAMHEMPGMEGDVRRHKKCKMCISSEKFPPAIDDTTLQDNRSCVGEQGRCSNSLERCSMSLVFDKEARPVKLIDRTLCREACEASENALDFTHLPSVDDESQEKSGGLSSGSLPCYDGGCPGETKCESKCLENSFHFSFEEAMAAVPRLYQNDGSYLHLLTPVISPPSADSVRRWLVAEKEGGARGISAVSLEPQSLKVASGCVVSAESSSSDDCGEAMLAESGSHTRDIFEQAAHEKDLVLDTKVNHDVNDLTSTPQSRGSTGDINTLVGDSQDRSQISGPDVKSKPTPLSQIGFRDSASIGAGQQLTLLSIEVQAECRGDLRPDPRFDAVNIISLAFQNDNDSAIKVHVLLYSKIESSQRNADGISGCKVFVFPEEKDLFGYFTKILCSLDPDIVMGWDVQAGSLGYLAERSAHLGIRLLNNISRILPEAKIVFESKVPQNESEGKIVDPLIAESAALGGAIIEDEWGRTHASGVHVGGRIVLNVWRLMRSDVKLNLYTVEAVAESVLMRKVPWIHHKVLRLWFSTGPSVARYRCIEYMVERAKLNLEMMNKLDMINRTSELARVFGIDFFSVLSRGSQYRVESMLLRLAHTQNYLAISPGNQQVASQPAMECIPLVMEPESGFYADPVVVLDFQSLYPSMIIAYNLCFCTCLGKVVSSKPNIMGVSSYSLDADVMKDLKDQILLAPNGAMYVPPKVRKGVLPRLLEEILSTRVLVKHAMKKLNPSQKILHRIFNARQLALKLIANVTYGYTAAGFSGRMPFAELADSIVECGRRTLEKAIAYVNANEKWRAKVVYGDTDSMFVMLKGRSSKEAFEIGNEIASAITAMNPNPVTLKMEKVYQPCFLLTKKRYVGYSYESPDQVKPLFDAKGIETVRRDTCRAVSKTVEQSLRLFFEHQDISEVKTYLQRQWTRIMSGRVSLQDFVFAKEVRLGTYSTSSSILPPAAIVAMKAMRVDPRAEPRYAERVPYVVIHGEPGARLIDMVVDPLQLLALDSPYRLNDLYYINKQIVPAVQRVFGLVGADLKLWFLEMPRPVRKAYDKHGFNTPSPHKRRIDYYYLSKHCILCGELVQASAHLCAKCCHNEVGSTAAIIGRTAKLESDMQHLAAICRHCGGGDWLMESGVKCTSLACSVFYERRKVQKELRGLSAIAHEKGLYPKCVIEWF